jgi:hypothetical protein
VSGSAYIYDHVHDYVYVYVCVTPVQISIYRIGSLVNVDVDENVTKT